MFSIVLNRALTRATREGRLVGLPALLDGTDPGGRAVDIGEFQPDGHWVEAPRLWDELNPERIVGGRQLWDHVMETIERMPAGQRAVIILRDLEGCEAEEACTLLGISAENQRVLLHRARGRVRQTIDRLTGAPQSAPVAAAARRRAGSAGETALCRLMSWLLGGSVGDGFRSAYPSQGLSDRSPPPRRMVRAERNPSLLHQLSNLVDSPGGEVVSIVAQSGHRPGGNYGSKEGETGSGHACGNSEGSESNSALSARSPWSPPLAAISNRLLREAAWSRMFGRVELKNPFAR